MIDNSAAILVPLSFSYSWNSSIYFEVASGKAVYNDELAETFLTLRFS